MKAKTLLLVSASALLLFSCSGGENPSSSLAPSSESGETSAPSSSAPSSEETPSLSEELPSSEAPSSEEISSEDPSSESSEEPIPAEKANLFYQEGAIQENIGESALKAGQLGYWAGEGGSVSSFVKDENGYALSYQQPAGAWYGVQVFYKLPYSEAGDSYHIEMTFQSDVSGSFTFNGETLTLEGKKEFAYSGDFTCLTSTVLSLQLGVSGGTLLGGSLLRFSLPKITDNSNAAYHKVSFASGETLLKEIQVKDGRSVSAPDDPAAPEGKLFSGWFDGDEKYSPDAIITAEKAYQAKFSDASSAKKVTFKSEDGQTVLKEVSIAEGETLTRPTDITLFAYEIASWVKEDGSAYDFSSPVEESFTLLARTKIAPSTYFNASETGNVIPASNWRVNEDNSFEVYDLSPFGSDSASWWSQVNFLPIPSLDGKDYEISFSYRVNGSGGDVLIYDNAPVSDTLTLTPSEEFQSAKLSFSNKRSDAGKLTFELGAIRGVEKISFAVKDVRLTEK